MKLFISIHPMRDIAPTFSLVPAESDLPFKRERIFRFKIDRDGSALLHALTRVCLAVRSPFVWATELRLLPFVLYYYYYLK